MISVPLNFFKASECVPGKSGEYLCIIAPGGDIDSAFRYTSVLHYSMSFLKWNVTDTDTPDVARANEIPDVVYWADHVRAFEDKLTEAKNEADD